MKKLLENFLVLWILNWQFFRALELHYIEVPNNFPFFSSNRTTCGSNGIFSRRLDFSLYNVLPKMRINSIEVKVIMEISLFLLCEKFKLRICCNYAVKKFLKFSKLKVSGEWKKVSRREELL